jgi:hypothetical protein
MVAAISTTDAPSTPSAPAPDGHRNQGDVRSAQRSQSAKLTKQGITDPLHLRAEKDANRQPSHRAVDRWRARQKRLELVRKIQSISGHSRPDLHREHHHLPAT